MQKGWWCPNRALASTFGCPFQMNQPSFSVWPLADGLFRQADPFDCAPRRLYGLMRRILGGWRPSALRGILPTQSLREGESARNALRRSSLRSGLSLGAVKVGPDQ